MKRVVTLLCVLTLLLCGCTLQAQQDLPQPPTVTPETQTPSVTAQNAPETAADQTALPSVFPTQDAAAQPEPERQKEFRGVWLPYMELNPQNLRSAPDYQAYLEGVLAPLQRMEITDLFVQVRPFGDAIYPSAYFPAASCVCGTRGGTLPFDFLQVILDTASRFGFRVHAWINPYRLSATLKAPQDFQADRTVGAWLSSTADSGVRFLENGVYLNPASTQVQQLIADGVTELLDRYALAGIHLDDYFYPTTDTSFDAQSFEAYRAAGGTLPLAQWRMENVNMLLRSLYAIVKGKDPSVLFSISPAGNIQHDKADLFADVERWCREPGYCDMIMPQIYFGFQNAAQPFLQCFAQWQALCSGGQVRLVPGLAVYKIGTADDYAGAAGKDEWINDQTVLARQIAALRGAGCGFCCYSAKFVNFHETLCESAFQTGGDMV